MNRLIHIRWSDFESIKKPLPARDYGELSQNTRALIIDHTIEQNRRSLLSMSIGEHTAYIDNIDGFSVTEESRMIQDKTIDVMKKEHPERAYIFYDKCYGSSSELDVDPYYSAPCVNMVTRVK